MEFETLDLSDNVFSKWIRLGQNEIIEKFDLKLPSGLPNYPSYYFTKKNPNRYFKKHLGFTYCYNMGDPKRKGTINITDHKKLMVFRLKYDL